MEREVVAEAPASPVLLSLIAHELTQPLTAARGSILTLVQQPESLSERSVLLDIVMRNLDQLQSLITSLRLFGEVESKDWKIDTQPTSVLALFQEVVDDFPAATIKRRLNIICPEGLMVNADITLFRQVLSNLVGNAVKFGPPDSTIFLLARSERKDVIITVRDEGPGIPKNQRLRIFQKSVRLDYGKRGFGFGLYVAHAIVRAHRGRLFVDPDQRQGAMFTISIPHPT
jgi:signal transduction histidine kinase